MVGDFLVEKLLWGTEAPLEFRDPNKPVALRDCPAWEGTVSSAITEMKR